ncbi:AAA family ATPase [Alphaproteobacteria bacterium]|nr:AAA family ATPase [Alphaproteobacteria bacterium]
MPPEPQSELELSTGNFATVDPPVPFIYGKIIARGFITVVAAPGGTGKTALATAIATAMVSGQQLLHDAPKCPLRVSCWNLEDPQVDMRRRFRGVYKRYSTADGTESAALTGDCPSP